MPGYTLSLPTPEATPTVPERSMIAWAAGGSDGEMYVGEVDDPEGTALLIGSGYSRGSNANLSQEFFVADDGDGLAAFAAKIDGGETKIFRIELDGSGEAVVANLGAPNGSTQGFHLRRLGSTVVFQHYRSWVRFSFPDWTNEGQFLTISADHYSLDVIGPDQFALHAASSSTVARRFAGANGASLESYSIGLSGRVRWAPSRGQLLVKTANHLGWLTPGDFASFVNLYDPPQSAVGGIDFDPGRSAAGLILHAEDPDGSSPRLWTMEPDGSDHTHLSTFPSAQGTPPRIVLF